MNTFYMLTQQLTTWTDTVVVHLHLLPKELKLSVINILRLREEPNLNNPIKVKSFLIIIESFLSKITFKTGLEGEE